MTTLVIGRGLLGSAVVATSNSSARALVDVQWEAEHSTHELLLAAVQRHVQLHDRWSVAWCAGAGVVGTDAEHLHRETRYLQTVLTAMSSAPRPGRFFLASSAGGVHGAGSPTLIDEFTPVAPISEYGRNKVRQEALVADWAAATGHTVLIGRISNLYGPGQVLTKPQGLVSQVMARCLLRRPIILSVPEETQRDFIFTDDAARRVVAWLQQTGSSPPLVKIIASGRPVTLSKVFRVVRAVTGIEPRVIRRVTATSALQPLHLRFRSATLTSLDLIPARPLEVGARQTWDATLMRYGRSGLQLPLA